MDLHSLLLMVNLKCILCLEILTNDCTTCIHFINKQTCTRKFLFQPSKKFGNHHSRLENTFCQIEPNLRAGANRQSDNISCLLKQPPNKQCCINFSPDFRPTFFFFLSRTLNILSEIGHILPHSLHPEFSTWPLNSLLWFLTSHSSFIGFLPLCPTFCRQWEAPIHGHASESVQPAAGWNQCPPSRARTAETPACGMCEGQGAAWPSHWRWVWRCCCSFGSQAFSSGWGRSWPPSYFLVAYK